MNSDREYYFFGLKIAGDFGATIAVPVVAGALLGRYLDNLWGSTPFFIIAGFVLAALLSAMILYRKAKTYGKEYQKMCATKNQDMD